LQSLCQTSIEVAKVDDETVFLSLPEGGKSKLIQAKMYVPAHFTILTEYCDRVLFFTPENKTLVMALLHSIQERKA
jgi:hypothetical protein